MQDKYKVLLNQLMQGYHLEPYELDDLEGYLTSHLNTIKIMKGRLNNDLFIESHDKTKQYLKDKGESYIDNI